MDVRTHLFHISTTVSPHNIAAYQEPARETKRVDVDPSNVVLPPTDG